MDCYATGIEHVAAMKSSVQQSPHRSNRKHAVALRLMDRSVKRILHPVVKIHP